MIAALLLLGCRETLEAPAARGGDPLTRWDAALRAVVTDEGLVDYDALEARREDLDGFVAFLARANALEVGGKVDRHAFWINAYNALTIFQVLERGRPASVLDTPGWVPIPGSGFFLETDFQIGSSRLSLSEIEHERVRMKELDYRDHAALNCASRSCPPLRAGLYTPKGIARELDAQMTRWVDDPERGVRIEGDTVVFSPIFSWYARDFDAFSLGSDLCSIAAFHASEPLAGELIAMAERGCPHRFGTYDWSLNDASP